MPKFLTLDDIDVKEKIVLVRVDFNVPIKDGVITDDTRIRSSLPTIQHLVFAGARIVLLSHLGRPDGKPNSKYSLRPVVAKLQELLGKPVAFAESCIGPAAREAIAQIGVGQIVMLENTRFYAGEESNDPSFAEELASLGHFFVNDAFSVSHRAHATTVGIASLLPSAAGRLMQKELEALAKALENPNRPVAAIVGGAKVSTKLDLLRNFITKVDLLIPGGGMANSFIAAKGYSVGKSLFEKEMLDTAREILAEAEKHRCRMLLPSDVVLAEEIKEGAKSISAEINEIPENMMILDLGPKTVETIERELDSCHTVLWNGPLGVFEISPFDKATNQIAKRVAMLTKEGKILSVAGGGDTVAALKNAGVISEMSYVSTAGGAFLEWLEGKTLPGIAVLEQSALKAFK